MTVARSAKREHEMELDSHINLSQKHSKKYLCGDQCGENKQMNKHLYCWRISTTVGRVKMNEKKKNRSPWQ